ncbi:MAG: hypothetical protein AAF318_13450 [Pseudomonadota bacterium]
MKGLAAGLAAILAASVAKADIAVYRLPAGLEGAPKGQHLAELILRDHPDIGRVKDEILAATLTQAQFDALVAGPLPAAIANTSATVRAEMNGLAGGLNVVSVSNLGDGRLSADELWLFQFLPDVSDLIAGSAYGTRAREGVPRTTLAVQYDGATSEAAKPLFALTVHGDDFAAFGPAGFLGALSVLTADGVAGALIGPARPDLTPAEAAPLSGAALDLRRAAERTGGLHGLANALQDRPVGQDTAVILAGTDRLRVLERTPSGERAMRTPESATAPALGWDRPGEIAATGCLAAPGLATSCRSLAAREQWFALGESGPATSFGGDKGALHVIGAATGSAIALIAEPDAGTLTLSEPLGAIPHAAEVRFSDFALQRARTVPYGLWAITALSALALGIVITLLVRRHRSPLRKATDGA